MMKPISYGEALVALETRDERIAALEAKVAALEHGTAERDKRIAAFDDDLVDLLSTTMDDDQRARQELVEICVRGREELGTSTCRRLGKALARIEAGDIEQTVEALRSLRSLLSGNGHYDFAPKADGSPVGEWDEEADGWFDGHWVHLPKGPILED